MMSRRLIYVLLLLETCLYCVTLTGAQKHSRPSGYISSLVNDENGVITDASSSLLDLTGIYTGTWTRLQHPPAGSSSSNDNTTPLSSSSSSSRAAPVLMHEQSGRLMLQLTSGPSPERREDGMAGVQGVLRLSEGMLIFGPGIQRLQLSGITTVAPKDPQTLHAVLKPAALVRVPQRDGSNMDASSSSSSSRVQPPGSEVHRSPMEKVLGGVLGRLGLYQQQQQKQQKQQGGSVLHAGSMLSRKPFANVRWQPSSGTLSDLATAAATAAAAEALVAAAAATNVHGRFPAAAGTDSRVHNNGPSKDAACRFRLQLAVTSSSSTGSTKVVAGSTTGSTGSTNDAVGSTPHSYTLYQQALHAVNIATQAAAAAQQRRQQQRAMLEGLVVDGAQPRLLVLSWQQQQQQHGSGSQHVTALQLETKDADVTAVEAIGRSSSSTAPLLSNNEYPVAPVVVANLVEATKLHNSSVAGTAARRPARALLARGFPGYKAAAGADAADRVATTAAAVPAAVRSAVISASNKVRLLPAAIAPQQQQQQQEEEGVQGSTSTTPQQLSVLDTWMLPCSHPLQRTQQRCQAQQQRQQQQQRLVMQGVLFSDNCNASWALTAVRVPSGGVERQAMCYAIVVLLVCLLQVVVVRHQAQAVASSPAAALKLSLVGVCAGSQLDAFLSMAHLVAALAAADVCLPLLVVAAAQFALFAGADMALTVHVWRAHHQQRSQQRQQQQQQLLIGSNFGQTSALTVGLTGSALEAAAAAALRQWYVQGLNLRRLGGGNSSSSNVHNSDDGSSSNGSSLDGSSSSITSNVYAAFSALGDRLVAVVVLLVAGNSLLLLYVRFYLVLLSAIALSYTMAQLPLVLIAAYSFWIPQILHNIAATAKQPISPAYIISSTTARLLPPLYMFSCPGNFLQLPTQPLLALGLLAWVGVQVVLLLQQHYTHPHALVPQVLRPQKYDYHRPELPWQFRQFAVKKKNSCGPETLDCLACVGQITGVHDRQCCSAVRCMVSTDGRQLQQQQQQQGCVSDTRLQQRQQQQQVCAAGVGSSGRAGACQYCFGQLQHGKKLQHTSWQQQQQHWSLPLQQQRQHWPLPLQQQHDVSGAQVSSSGLLGVSALAQYRQQQQQLLRQVGPSSSSSSRSSVCKSCCSGSAQGCTYEQHQSSSSHSSSSHKDWHCFCSSLDASLHDVVEGYDASTGEGVVECVICMAAVPLTPLQARVVTPCGHFFHTDCLSQWIDVKAECPTCRWGPLPPL